MRTFHPVRRAIPAVLVAALSAGTVVAEPNLLAYPLGQVIFRYDERRYQVLEPSDVNFDAAYSIGGQMLWDGEEERVALEVYRAPGLAGFEPSPTGRNEFFARGSTKTLVIDGFSAVPRQFSNILVQFRPLPSYANATILANGERVEGLRHVIPRMVVSTPTANGFYSDTVTLDIEWSGAIHVEVFAYADRNGNRIFDGKLLYSVVMEDLTVPTEARTWGSIKAHYRNR